MVTPIGPVLTSATTVKSQDRNKGIVKRSRLAGATLANGQDTPMLANCYLTHYPLVNAVKSMRSNGQGPIWPVKIFDYGRRQDQLE